MAAAVSNLNAHVTETDMHVQHSEQTQTARDQLAISPSQLPTDSESAQVALNVESMPEQAIVNSTTHDAAQPARGLVVLRRWRGAEGVSAGSAATRQSASGHTVRTVTLRHRSSRDWGGD